jgi:altronate dehydratase
MSSSVKVKVQSFGRFLSNMVMPNIGAFIAWGIITALFIPTGWIPNVTLCAAGGYVAHFFPTGQGNVIGNPILPVIKVCANPRTVRTMSEHIDVDVSAVLRREMNLDGAGDALLECLLRTANGRLTAAEALGHREFVLTRIFESA